jgi:hypothetical protein
LQDKRTWLKEYFDPLAALMKSGQFHWETFEQRDIHTDDRRLRSGDRGTEIKGDGRTVDC